jgi:transcriptional regulator with XRE-family HTH domain
VHDILAATGGTEMTFCEKLQVYRKKEGLSQEELAARIGITRQAVGKWECGEASPDINNLLSLSSLFNVSVDRLIKSDDECNILPGRTVTEYDSEERQSAALISFLIKAKQHTYAGKGTECDPSRPQSHDLRYNGNDFLYIDTYIGGEQFAGEEGAWQQTEKSSEPVWAMNYSGRITGEHFSGDFLKEALFHVPVERPFRGPVIYRSGDYIYHCRNTGSFAWYQGCEEIYYSGALIYECVFHGGKII